MKNQTIYTCLSILLLSILMTSCEVFMEDDIEKDAINILAPADGIVTEIVTQTFWWEEIDGAKTYRLQIVTPSFESAETILEDTLVSGDKYESTLYAGDFQWRVRGENSAYVTGWTTAGFTIVSSDDLTRQKVRLRQPADNAFTNQTSIEFKWDTIPYADSYELRLYKGGWDQTLVLDSIDIKNNYVTIEADEAELYWGVRAINQKSESLFNTQRVVVDLTSPNIPELLLPENNASLSDTTVTFTWKSSDPVWNEVTDSLFIYEERSVLGDQLIHQGKYSKKEATVKLNSGKTYIWLVKSVDKAGNNGLDSKEKKFQVVNL